MAEKTAGDPFWPTHYRILRAAMDRQKQALVIMALLNRNRPFRYRFDFDIGYLVKSPCRGCEDRDDFPRCMDACEVIDRIHTALAESVSCSNRKN